MNKNSLKKPFLLVFMIYLLCYALHIAEYFLLRTDQTVIGEAVIHKILGIVILAIAAKKLGFSAKKIGFTSGKNFWNILKGLAFGAAVFILAYTTEVMIAVSQGNFSSLKLYVSAYAIDKNIGNRTELIFFVICIIGNVINVIMEEGNFRGLFIEILGSKYSFFKATLISSVLFGFWHVIGPVRNYFDGEQSLNGMIFNALFLLVASALVGIKFTMLTKMTGSLYFSMADHFFNNTIVNLLHVVTDTGADELMTVRVSIAQTVSFAIVLICYCIWRKNHAADNERKPEYGRTGSND
ncbi:MAG: CPBP family intramembrane metalloprotease [Lachnospiraceae bacterium]|nr:CPBP family intramembrane metalloprotease [Lachnospiraceae bacterium]